MNARERINARRRAAREITPVEKWRREMILLSCIIAMLIYLFICIAAR